MTETLNDLKTTGAFEFRTEPTKETYISRNGRTVHKTAGMEYARTKAGLIPLSEWYSRLEEAVKIEGKETLLKSIEHHVRKCAWLKSEQDRHQYALQCIVDEAYKCWKDFTA